VDFSDQKAMLGLVEKFAEIAAAQSQVFLKAGSPDEFQAEAKRLQNVGGVLIGANTQRGTAYKNDDPKGVDEQLKKISDVIDDIEAISKAFRKLYRNNLKDMLSAERKKKASVNSSDKMQAAMLDEFYEMAHVGRLLVERFNAKAAVDKKTKEVPLDKMELGQIAAIYGYSTNDYNKLNARLRDPGKGDPGLDGYIDACTQGLKALPSFKGAVVRCDQSAKYFFDEIAASGIRTEKAFMSSGLKKVPGFGDVETHITKVKSGKEITAFSLHQTEGEVLFPPGSVFKFVRCEVNGQKFKKYKDLKAAFPEGGKSITSGVFEFVQVR
jgi:hypothetical protein